MLDRFLRWLSSLGEAERSLAPRPAGVSRRSFLRALGVTAVSATIATAVPIGWQAIGLPDQEEETEIERLIRTTLADLCQLKWTDISSDLRSHHAMRRLLKRQHVNVNYSIPVQWNVKGLVHV